MAEFPAELDNLIKSEVEYNHRCVDSQALAIALMESQLLQIT